MNEFLTNEITHRELGVALTSMAWGKALGHDGISIDKNYGQPCDLDFHVLILKGSKRGHFMMESLKASLALSPKGGGGKRALDYWRSITLLPTIYMFFWLKPCN
jgi:hypothetical protein